MVYLDHGGMVFGVSLGSGVKCCHIRSRESRSFNCMGCCLSNDCFGVG